MARDGLTEAIFTTADDQIQGLWAWHRYAEQAINMAAPDEVAKGFPPNAYPMTHEWVRSYDPQEMAKAVVQFHPFILVRQSLIGLVTICEAALFRLNERLASLGNSEQVSKTFKLLEWAFKMVRNPPWASKQATARLPQTCGDIDNARRLRNCIAHRNGCYDEEMYLQQVIKDGWVVPQYERDWDRKVRAGEPIFLDTARFEYFYRSNLEFLHILHDTIQYKIFGHKDGYNYAHEGKQTEWHRILSGRRDVKM
jgi:hypothetical protein